MCRYCGWASKTKTSNGILISTDDQQMLSAILKQENNLLSKINLNQEKFESIISSLIIKINMLENKNYFISKAPELLNVNKNLPQNSKNNIQRSLWNNPCNGTQNYRLFTKQNIKNTSKQ